MQISKTAEPQRRTSPRDLHTVFERQELFLQKRRKKEKKKEKKKSALVQDGRVHIRVNINELLHYITS